MDVAERAASMLATTRDLLWRNNLGPHADPRQVAAAEKTEEARLLLLPVARAEAESDGLDVREGPLDDWARLG